LKKPVILVVEDEAIIRMGTVQMLRDAGYKVLDAANADIAIGILEARSDIMAVLTDIKMPGSLCGLRLVHVIQGRWPPIHLIVASGLPAPAEADFPPMARFIRKPYAPKLVLQVLDEIFSLSPVPYRYRECVARQEYGRVA
jgi:CheY-like chemotaxis protein